MVSLTVACVYQSKEAMRPISKGVIYILMQVRHNAEICNAVGTESAYYFGLCYFGLYVR